tara:strand:- start:142 stop:393 length:252 start_codon:yes stop_codon:yes gene_type:complete
MNEPEATPTTKIVKKFRKGDLIKVDRQAYQDSIEANASDVHAPDYIFDGPGELLVIKGDYGQIRWRRPVPDVWLRLDQLRNWE